MKLRDLLLVLIALALLSTVIGVAVLYRLYVWNASPPAPSPMLTAPDPSTKALPPTALKTATPLPPLITPTPSPLPSATPTPSHTPSPTPTPTTTPTLTPTPLPAERLAGAHRARRNGEYAVAQAELQTVLQAPDAEWEAAEARYQIGIVAYLGGEYTTAQDTLMQFIEQYPQDHRVGTAHFYLGETLTRMGELAAAIENYEEYVKQQDVLSDLVYTRIAQNYQGIGAYQDAIEAYQRALDRALDLGQQYDLREQIALAYSAWGRYPDAISWLQGIAEQSQNVYRLARIWYLIGETHRLDGQEEQALRAFTQAVNGDPRPGYAHVALVALLDAGVEVNEYQRGLIDYYAGSYEAAAAAFSRYIAAMPDTGSDARYYLVLSYLEAGSPDLAIQACERALKRVDPADRRWGDFWLLKGQALARIGNDDEAVATYITFADTYSDYGLAPEARWKAAQLLEQAGRFREAAGEYTALADAHVNAARAPAARFRAGISRYRSGDIDAAMAAWRELETSYPASRESFAARYWLGKVLWSRGQAQEAHAMLQALTDEQPRDYYGLRAAHLVQAKGYANWWYVRFQSSLSDNLRLTSYEQAEKQEAAEWLHDWTGTSGEWSLSAADPSAVSADLAGHLFFRRAMELNTLSLRTEARDTFEQLRKEIAQNPTNQLGPLALYQLALVTRDLELYAPSIRATIDLIVAAPESSVLEMPRLIQRLAFPTYYSDLILAECATYDLDPLLMFALIRQESVFDAQATSWAGAVGLAQVMPSTGDWIAEMIALPDYDQEILRRAYLNVKFGTWFLARILEQAEGNVMAALAGYNGGPARAKGWLEQAGGDPDLFVEVITCGLQSACEPQSYVQLIYRHYDVYARLYGAE